MTTRTLNTFALISAWMSGIFMTMIVTTFVGAVTRIIPLWGVQTIARYWGIICLVYVATQFWPLLAARTATDRTFKVDRYTSWWPLAANLVFTGVFAIFVAADSYLWIMVAENFLASMIDLVIVHITLTIREMIPVPAPAPAPRVQPAAPQIAAPPVPAPAPRPPGP